MYAVVNSGGKQYKVQKGEVLKVEKISGDVGNSVTFDRVLMFSDGENVSIGQPVLDGVSVEGHIVEQEFTAVLIDSINAKGTKATKAAEPKAEAKAEVKESEAKKTASEKAAPEKAVAKEAKE